MIVEVGIFLVLAGIILLSIVLPEFVKQWKCKHETYYENGSCDAICRNCGKNLGFIGRIRGNKI